MAKAHLEKNHEIWFKNKSKGFLHLIMYGKEVKIKHYDYMLYTSIEHKIIIIPKIQVESGGYTFFSAN
jgi:hypothetical protein